MKTIGIISLIISIFLFSNCSKYLVPESELPQWLIDRIEKDEAAIKDNPNSFLRFGKWTRYEYLDTFYYEYTNDNEDGTKIPIDHEGNGILDFDLFTEYSAGKCCDTVVWKGSRAD